MPLRVLAAIASAAAVLVVATLASVATAAPLFADNFDDGNANGWTTSGGSWSVSSGAYQQTGTSSDARARAGSASWANYTVSVRVRANAFNGSNRFVAVLARAQSNTSYYYVALRSNNTVELKKLVNGSATTLVATSVNVSIGTWYTLTLRVDGSTLTSQVNGGSTLTASDSQYASGQIGVATFNASATFDDVNVESGTTPPSPSASPSASPTSSPSPSPSVSPTGSPQPPAGQPDGFAAGTTGGAGGPTVVVRTTNELLTAIDTIGPLNIHVQGTINITSKQGVRPNKTILGLGSTATINGGGFDFYRSYNVIIRNLTFTNAEDDAVNVGQNSHHIWIDHNRFVSPVDGAIDIVRGSEYVTVSWNHFDHTDKSMLIGHSDSNSGEDTGHLKVSIHHNWFDNSRQRHPRVRFGEPVHVYNNYFLNNELYAVASTMNGGVLVEGNYFQNVPFPCYSASGYAESGPGRLVQRNNIFTGSGACEVNGSVAAPPYSYTLTPTANVPSVVMAGVGVGKL
nr:family 16 glycoside hydrolase [Allorhizocola rhizosphaerae]